MQKAIVNKNDEHLDKTAAATTKVETSYFIVGIKEANAVKLHYALVFRVNAQPNNKKQLLIMSESILFVDNKFKELPIFACRFSSHVDSTQMTLSIDTPAFLILSLSIIIFAEILHRIFSLSF